MMPTPGIVASNWLTLFSGATWPVALRSHAIAPSCPLTDPPPSAGSSGPVPAAALFMPRPPSGSSTWRSPCAAMMPNSAIWARRALTSMVRCRTSRLRARCSISTVLLVGALYRHEAHRRARHRLADRLSVGCVVLIPLDVRLHVSRRHQLHLMAERGQLARPMVGRRAGFHADQARLQRLKIGRTSLRRSFAGGRRPFHRRRRRGPETRSWRDQGQSW